jgi:hypothetical protein
MRHTGVEEGSIVIATPLTLSAVIIIGALSFISKPTLPRHSY